MIRQAQRRFPNVDGRFIGQGFRLLAKQGKIQRVGYCKPDANASGDHFFCSWKCALVWLNRRYAA